MEDTTPTTQPVPQAQDTAAQAAPARAGSDRRSPRPGAGGRRPDSRASRGPRRDERPRSEFDQKTLEIRRVSRTVAGGRRFNFSVAMVVGDRKGAVGVGLGKAGDTAAAIDKAVRAAKKNVIRIPLTKNKSLRHDVSAKFGSSEIVLYPAVGRGLVAGSSLRTVLELAGITDVTGKVLSRSKNKVNNARAAVEALKTLI